MPSGTDGIGANQSSIKKLKGAAHAIKQEKTNVHERKKVCTTKMTDEEK